MRYWETAASTGQRSAPHQPGDSAADTRYQRRSGAFSLFAHSEPPLKQIVRTAGRWRVTA
nr:MAG TPA: hypothetical protein [Caudoviricetes sp.]DAH81368.1 MAG TPA: hypothetical protein [Caudoviricetes sp.]